MLSWIACALKLTHFAGTSTLCRRKTPSYAMLLDRMRLKQRELHHLLLCLRLRTIILPERTGPTVDRSAGRERARKTE